MWITCDECSERLDVPAEVDGPPPLRYIDPPDRASVEFRTYWSAIDAGWGIYSGTSRQARYLCSACRRLADASRERDRVTIQLAQQQARSASLAEQVADLNRRVEDAERDHPRLGAVRGRSGVDAGSGHLVDRAAT